MTVPNMLIAACVNPIDDQIYQLIKLRSLGTESKETMLLPTPEIPTDGGRPV